jgi:hypothetical protein
MKLLDFEKRWRDFLRSDSCPPVLGLAPVPESEIQSISVAMNRLVPNDTVTSRLKYLLGVLNAYPATAAIWLTRKAAEAYDFGAFWGRFEEGIGFIIPLARREELAADFRRACRTVMSNHVEPRRRVAQIHVAPFLFQAGLPLCHCSRFADLVRSVEQQFGLPDPDSPESGEDLRDHILEIGTYALVPVLRRALEGPAGRLICKSAASVVMNGQYHDINPVLGEALQTAFSRQSGVALNRAARPPYLRLRSDQTGFEIVGPRQEAGLIEEGQLTWVINGSVHRTSVYEEFTYPVGDESRVTVELRGLRKGLSSSQTFILKLEDREQPFILFSMETRRAVREQRGQTVWLRSGRYWLWRPKASEITPAPEIDYMIGDQEGSLAEVCIDPTKSWKLTLADRREFQFQAELTPFIRYTGRYLSTDSGDEIHYGWSTLPEVWLPVTNDAAGSRQWMLKLTTGKVERSYSLIGGTAEGSMEVHRISDPQFLREIGPGLHSLQFSVFQGMRRVLASEFRLWVGLASYTRRREFLLAEFPANLIHDRCSGFEISRDKICHLLDGLRQHCLTFRVGNDLITFSWSRQGLFLESYQKTAGRPAVFLPQDLGSSLPASVDSPTWVRIWLVPADDADITFSGEIIQKIRALERRNFVDLSLSHLIASQPRGGIVRLRLGDTERDLFELTQTLLPMSLHRNGRGLHLTITLNFAEKLGKFRVRAQNIVTSEVIEFSEHDSQLAGFGVVDMALPVPIRISYENSQQGRPGYTLAVSAFPESWPPGFWMVSLEASREGSSGLQLISDSKGRQIALLVPVTRDSLDPQSNFLSLSYGGLPTQGAEEELTANDRYDLVSKLFRVHRRRFAPQIADDFAWLKALMRSLVRRIDSTLEGASSDEIARLLTLASTADETYSEVLEESKSLFVTMPRLAAIAARRYLHVPPTSALTRALRWCGNLAAQELALDVFLPALKQIQTGRESETVKFLRGFSNFASVVAMDPEKEGRKDFQLFDFEHFRTRTLGTIYSAERHSEYDEFSLFGRSHFEWALTRFEDHRAKCPEDFDFGRVNALLNSALQFRNWLKQRIDPESNLLPSSTWAHPWPTVSLDNNAFAENCVQFASVYALAARACGNGMLEFSRVIEWLGKHTNGSSISEQTIVTLVEISPELLGYYLMFWELILRTGPHGRA